MHPDITAYLHAWKSGDISPSPANRLIGSHLSDFGDGWAEVRLDITENVLNSFGTIQGGILCSLGDAAMGTAVVTTLDQGETFHTVNLTSMFCRPASKGQLRAEARVVHRSRSVASVECDIFGGDKVVSRLSCTCVIKKK